jgi:hypothetical protein
MLVSEQPTDSLPFTGRAGEGMGIGIGAVDAETHPPPSLPLEGGGVPPC